MMNSMKINSGKKQILQHQAENETRNDPENNITELQQFDNSTLGRNT